MARLPPPCHPLYCRLRLFDRRTRRHPPLRTTFLLAALGICHSRRLPTQRRCRSDPNGTSPTRSQQSEGASSSRSPGPSQDALAAIRRSARRQEFPITDAVRLTKCLTQKPTSPGYRQPLTAFETHNGRSTFAAGTALRAPLSSFFSPGRGCPLSG